MQSPFYFIAKPVGGRRYDNLKNIGGVEFITSSSEEDAKASNRFAEVVSVPLGYEGKIVSGDVLLVHHNVFKFYNAIDGTRKSGKSFFKDDLFFIELEQFFLYNHEGIWYPYDRYCFVKPLDVIKSTIEKGCQYEPLMGTVKYANDYLLSKGVNVGDTVCYQPESEYEYRVDGELLYRMFDHQITVKL